MNQRAGTHRARLDGRIHRSPGQAVIAERSRGFPDSDDLCVGCRIARSDHRIAPSSYNDAVEGDHCPDRDFTVGVRCFRFRKRFVH
jgi:hypothetical protein